MGTPVLWNWRAPFLDCIPDDAGYGFLVGAMGGSVLHFLRGLSNSPNGYRLTGGAQAVRINAPRIASNWAAWMGVFSAFECALASARKKEDPWNPIVAGGAVSGLGSLRLGGRVAGRSALFTAAVVAVIEGAVLTLEHMTPTLQRVRARPLRDLPPHRRDGPAVSRVGFLGIPPAPPIVIREVSVPDDSAAFRGWFRGLLTNKEDEGKVGGDCGGRQPEMFEEFS